MRVEEELDDGRTKAADDADRDGDAAEVGSVGEVTMSPMGTQATERSDGGASNNTKTLMENMEVGEGGITEEEEEKMEGGDVVEEGGGGLVGSLLELEATGLLTQEEEPGSTILVNACNDFNELIRLAILWTVHHHWPVGARFMFNCYRHWAHILLLRTSDAPLLILSWERVTQGDPLLMVLHGITRVLLTEELRDVDPTLLSPF